MKNKREISREIHIQYGRLKILRNIFSLNFPISNKNNSISCKPFFIIGSGRSGSTLLRAILVNNSKIAIPPESYVLPNTVRIFWTYNFLPWKELVKLIIGEFESHNDFCSWDINMQDAYSRILNLNKKNQTLANIIDEIYCYYAELKFPDFEIWGDKTPYNTLKLDWIDLIFSNAKYIHIIRDGRDVVSSYLKMGRYKTVEEAAHRWKKSIELCEEFKKNKSENEYIEIRYEKLVTEPDHEIKCICNFLNIDFDISMLDIKKIVCKLGDVDVKQHENIKNPINANSIGKWEKNLTDKEKIKVKELLNDTLSELNYRI